jgi:transposase
MYKDGSSFKKIYSACGYIDLRYGVDGLAATVQQVFQLDPCDEGTFFLFCGRRSDRSKALVWEAHIASEFGFYVNAQRTLKNNYYNMKARRIYNLSELLLS